MSEMQINEKQAANSLIDDGLKYILCDLHTIEENRTQLPMSFPQILLVFSGIEFITSLIYPQEGKITDRVSKYITCYMPARYDRNEGSVSLGTFLYDSLRSGLVHYGNVKGDIVVDHDITALAYHLMWVEHNGERRLFIHGYKLAEDFIASVEKVKNAINDNTITLDILQTNATRLNTELAKSRKRDPHSQWNSGPTLEARLMDATNVKLPPDVGSTYDGGIL